jgi:hypothetical protein
MNWIAAIMMTKYVSTKPKFEPEDGFECPCCHEVALEKAFQEPIVPGKPGNWYYHCKNPSCKGYNRTMKLDQFIAEFGKE